MKLKTTNWPEGRSWPDEILLDVGSNMPMDVHGVKDAEFGVRYIRYDLATLRVDEREFLDRVDAAIEARKLKAHQA